MAEGCADEAVALALSLVGGGAALCSHGDVLPPVLDAVLHQASTSEEAWEKGATWKIVGRTVPADAAFATYLSPPA